MNHVAAVNLHCDLIANSFLHRAFLEKIHQEVVTLLNPLPHESLRRYRDLWLPLAYNHPRFILIPPPDIAWLWHCHRLAPREYVNYIEHRFGVASIVEANPPFAVQTANEQSLEMCTSLATRELWCQVYANEPFFLLKINNHNLPNLHPKKKDMDLMSGFDLVGSSQRQSTLLWQVSGKEYLDAAFLQQARHHYIKFLKLGQKAAARGVLLIPTMSIDWMWHTHILSSVTMYHRDCVAVLGATLHHDDSQTERSPGSIQDLAYQATKQLWMEEYGEDYAISGGLYRGEPPTLFFQRNWSISQQYSNDVVDVSDEVPFADSSLMTTARPPPLLQHWAYAKGTTSDGSPALIKVTAKSRKDLKHLRKREKYILGWTDVYGFGYYHLETREANILIERRMAAHCKYLESNIAMERSLCGKKHRSLQFEEQEKELANAKALLLEMRARSRAKCPSGVVRSAEKDKAWMNGCNALYTESGVWLYPPTIWNNCGGGCGGMVASSPTGYGDNTMGLEK